MMKRKEGSLMKRAVLLTAAVLSLISVTVIQGVSQFRTPMDFIRMGRFVCPLTRDIEAAWGKGPAANGYGGSSGYGSCSGCSGGCSSCAPRSSAPSIQPVSSNSSPMVYVNVAPPQQQQAAQGGAARNRRGGMAGYDEFENGFGGQSGFGGFQEPRDYLERPGPIMQGPYSPPRYAYVPEKQPSCWMIGPVGMGFFRYAKEAFWDPTDTNQSAFGGLFSSNDTTQDTTLSPLWFGKETFYVEELFAGGMLTPEELGDEYNPYLSFSALKPTLDFMDSAFFAGAHFEYRTDCTRAGIVVGVTYRYSKVAVVSFEETGLNDVVCDAALDAVVDGCPPGLPDICDPSTINTDFAYRLDFASAIVKYGGPTLGTPTKIGDVQIGDSITNAPVYLTKRDDETAPDKMPLPGSSPSVSTWGKAASQVSGELPADGSGTDDDSYHFSGSAGVDYASNLGQDRDMDRTLWIVPHYRTVGGKPVYDSNRTTKVQQALRALLSQAVDGDTATEFLASKGINITSDESTSGLGDVLAHMYLSYCAKNFGLCATAEMTLPTGGKQTDARQTYFMPTGNNGHFAAKFGVEASAFMVKYFRLGLGLSYYIATPTTEQKASPFVGATIRNIGTGSEADTSWEAMQMNFTCDIYIAGFGIGLGYEGFSKTKDSVSMKSPTATDLYGREEPLDANILQVATNSVAQKLLGDIFYFTDSGRFFMGGSYIPSGRNVMKEHEFHIGFVASF